MADGIVLSGAGLSSGDARYATARLPVASPHVAETYPRWASDAVNAPTAGVVYAARITLQPAAYTTVTLATSVQGVTLANTFFGLYETSGLTRVAISANVSTELAAIGAGQTGTLALSYTAAAVADFYLSFVIGSASTMPQLASGASGSQNTGMHALAPRIFCVHSATGQTSLPTTLVEATGSTIRHWWFRYS